MARQARIVVPRYPYHVVHQGNLRAQVFFSDDDRRFDGEMLGNAPRYVELNPVRARKAGGAGQWPWSTARAHPGLAPDALLAAGRPFPDSWTGQWQAFLNQELTRQQIACIRQNIATGRPTASREFIKQLEVDTGKVLTPQRRGPKPAPDGRIVDLQRICLGEWVQRYENHYENQWGQWCASPKFLATG